MGPDGIGTAGGHRSVRHLALASVFLLVLAACGAHASGEEATGIVVDVQGELEEIDTFTVLIDGEQVTFETSPDADYAFPLGHLRDHLRSGEPVVVRWETEGERRVATSIDDA